MRLFRNILTLLTVILLSAAPSPCQNVSTQQARKARLEREIRILEDQIAANSKRTNSAAVSLKLIQEKIRARSELLEASELELRTIHDSLYITQKEISRLQARLDTMTTYYSRLVKNAYKNRDARIWYMYILASENIGQATRRYGYLRTLSKTMSTQAAAINEAKSSLVAKKEKMAVLWDKALAIRNAHQTELSKLKKEKQSSESLVAQLKRDKQKYQGQIQSKQSEIKALQRQIEKLISGNISTGSKTKTDTALSRQFADNAGKLPWPADGPVVERFGQQTHPVYKNIRLPFNNGISIALPPDADISAVFDGVVKSVIVMPGYNQCVLIQHGDYFTFYCKLSSVKVRAGEKVKTGQVIGQVTTIAGETQLHFQLWKGRTPQNPLNWLK